MATLITNAIRSLLGLLTNVKGNTFVSADCVTSVKLKGGKSNPYQNRITKHSTINGQLFSNQEYNAYEAMVNRRLEAEGKPADFTVAARRWGTRVSGTPIIEHKGNYYMEVNVKSVSNTFYKVDGDGHYSRSELEAMGVTGFPVSSGSGRQGLEDDNAVILRTYRFDSLRNVRMHRQEVNVGEWVPA